MRIIILGPPGVGKGTQSGLIAKKLSIKHLSTGEILRRAVFEGTELGKKAKAIMDAGELVSDSIMIGIIRDCLQSKEVCEGFILDGFPRTKAQAEDLDKLFDELKIDDIKILCLNADKDELIKRMSGRGRRDDNIETISNRLNIYKEQTLPVKEYYRKSKKVFEIDGLGDIDEINDNILKLLTLKD